MGFTRVEQEESASGMERVDYRTATIVENHEKYVVSYRISANFLDWVMRTFDRDLVKKLNAAVREGCYDELLWRTWSGKSVQQLGEEWLVAQRSRLSEGH